MTSTIELDLSGWARLHRTDLILLVCLFAVLAVSLVVLFHALSRRRPVMAGIAAGVAVAMAVSPALLPRQAPFTRRVEQEAHISALACPSPIRAPDMTGARQDHLDCTWSRDGRTVKGTLTVWPLDDPDRPAHVLLRGRIQEV